jgi:iodotyrosine deiodinase
LQSLSQLVLKNRRKKFKNREIEINKSVSRQSTAMLEQLQKSFFIQNWEFTVIIVTIVYFIVRFRDNRANLNGTRNSRELKRNNRNDDEVIADDFKNDGDNEEEDDDLTPSLENVNLIPYKGASVTLNGGVNEFYQMINDRRSVRKFSNKKVDIEIVKKCIQAAGTAPSGAHTEPWTFCLIQRY